MCFTFRQTNPASDLHWQKITLMAFRWKVLKFLNFSNVQTSLLISSDWFRLFDKNRDGFITKKEFRWMTTSAVISHETIDCVFKRFNLESLSFSLEGSTSMRMENLTWESLQLWFKGTGGKIWNRSKEHFWGLGKSPSSIVFFIVEVEEEEAVLVIILTLFLLLLLLLFTLLLLSRWRKEEAAAREELERERLRARSRYRKKSDS